MMPQPATPIFNGPDDLARVFPVSRETVDRLEIYESALHKWQRAVNLVAPATLSTAWSRHFADSLQLLAHVPENAKTLADLGSGAGFPGLVLAAHFAGSGGPSVTLVESDRRKAAFLRDTARAMQISVDILSTRIENDANLPLLKCADVVTARALAPLGRLIGLVAPFISSATVCIFPKGREVEAELIAARKNWQFDVAAHPSLTDPTAHILVVRNVAALTD